MALDLARLSRIAGCSILIAAIASADVTILGKPGSYATIQAAVHAAVDGDVLLVGAGTYPGFTIDDKSLSVIAASSAQGVDVNTGCSIVNLAGHRAVLLAGLRIGQLGSAFSQPGLTLQDNAGHVRALACWFTGGAYYGNYPDEGEPHGVVATNSLRVVMTQCLIRGHSGGQPSGYPPRPGGDGVRAQNSGIALFECTISGGKGSEETAPSGGDGGVGFRIDGYGMFVSGCSIHGGGGGGGDYIGCTSPGDGGHGLLINGALAQLLDTAPKGGVAGIFGACGTAVPGQPIVNNGGTLVQIVGTARKLSGPAQVFDNSTSQFVVDGEPGDQVWLLHASRPGFLFVPALHGLVAVPFPLHLKVTPAGVIGATGSLVVPVAIGDLLGPEPGWIWFVQGLCVQPDGQSYMTSPLHVLVHNT